MRIFMEGYVIHVSSGTAGWIGTCACRRKCGRCTEPELLGSYWIGPRHETDRHDWRPNNILVG